VNEDFYRTRSVIAPSKRASVMRNASAATLIRRHTTRRITPAVCAAESKAQLLAFSQAGNEAMAWGGKTQTRMRPKQRDYFLRHTHRRLPPVDNPHGIPSAVLEQLASERLPDKESYSRRLNELMAAPKQKG
jgi:hypothetical protein